MTEAAFRHHGLAWRHLTIEVAPETFADALRKIEAVIRLLRHPLAVG
jgi:hypothetical protein